MGMDLIVNVAVREYPERTPDDLKLKLIELDEIQAREIFDGVQGITWEEYCDDFDESAIPTVKAWLIEFIEAMENWHRSIVFLDHPQLNKRIAIGGGDSYGDTPSGLDAVSAAALWGEW